MTQGDASVAGGAVEIGGEKLEEPDHSSSNWYFPREHIEKNSPSRKDGIDLKKETYLRKSYCTFLQDLGMRLKVPQVTIATSIVFCHRFFLRQSHSKNDRYLIATSCMFLAGKVEETPQKLCDVIFLSYEIRNKKDPTAVQRIKQKDLYEPQKELVLLGERLVLTTLGFDLNIHHPYKPLVAAIKKFKVAQNALAQVAWNFVNDGLRTSLCLQFKPHHIAAGAIFLAAKFLKVKLPSEGEKVWWQEFEVTPRQLEEVSNQMLELYEQNRDAPASRVSEPSASGHNRATEVLMGSSARMPDKNLSADGKGRGNASHIWSVHEASSSATDRKSDTNANETVGQRSRTNISANMDCEPKVSAQLCSENLILESRGLPDISRISNPSAELSRSAVQVVETESHVEAGKDKKRHSNDVALPAVQGVEEIMDWKPKEDRGSRAAGKSIDAYSVAGKEQKKHDCTLQESQQKSEWVDLADVNIDRVKAAIQRRKKGDNKPSTAKRELTDEEELLEMDFENGHLNVQDLGTEELLERNLERAEGNSQVQRRYDERPNVTTDSCLWVDGEKQGRDHKKPRFDFGK